MGLLNECTLRCERLVTTLSVNPISEHRYSLSRYVERFWLPSEEVNFSVWNFRQCGKIGGRIFGVGALLVIFLHKPVYSQGSNLLQPTTYQLTLNTPWSLLGTTLSSANLDLITPKVAPSISKLDSANSPESCVHGTKQLADTPRAWGVNLTDTTLFRFFPSGKMQRDASGDGNYSSNSWGTMEL